MREIKFRGISKVTGEFVFGDLIHNAFDGTLSHDVAIAVDGNHYQSIGVIPESVGQFTGLKDAGGVDIYEGDILTESGWFYIDAKKREHYEITGVVEFNNSLAFFYLRNVENKLISPFFSSILQKHDVSYSVIGNIHLNPELLNSPLTQT
jgi:uncharacterized phage protein (TIGR01671 family)